MPCWVPNLSCSDLPNPIPYGRADGYSKAVYSVADAEDILSVQGVEIPEVDQCWTSKLTKESPDTEVTSVCHEWAKQIDPSASYIAGGSMELAFIATVMFGYIKGLASYGTGAWKTMSDCRKLIFTAENRTEDDVDIESDLSGSRQIINRIREALSRRSLFGTVEGHIGLCPASVERGDLLAVMLGCEYPLVLRPEHGGSFFKVVGVCYVSTQSLPFYSPEFVADLRLLKNMLHCIPLIVVFWKRYSTF
ncbi:uncharacterized protein RSE6_11414 [Rhynchosporium secalis]|uniref:Uncharacterized protein n=1 Tax=Rhynchosporium secalis TaxID=38038 RepID=A0A1E1MMW6_RHYSE|nr:uncharacterized protein RSE6_11414 [Rhynchosporium secalis]